MSKKTYVEAIEYVLDTELDAREDLICLRPGAKRAFEEAERDVPLPRMGAQSLFAALGAALQGMHPVLDLRQETGAMQFLREAVMELPEGCSPAITVIACRESGEAELPGAYVFAPGTPRQAAGFLRSALKMEKLTVVLADQALFAEADDIPEDRSFTLLPLDDGGDIDEETAYDEAEAEEAKVIVMDEEEAYEAAEAETCRVFEVNTAAAPDEEAQETGEDEAEEAAIAEEMPVKKEYAFLATRQTVCDLSSVRSLCALLEMDEEMLIGRCAGHVLPVSGFELHTETDAPAGEAAFLPPEEESASLWLGGDRLTIAYDAARLPHADAAALLRAVKRVLETPQLLIYDKEYEKE